MTETIARIAGPYLLVTALGFLVSRRFYERMVLGNANSDPVLLNVTGAVHFVIGMVVLVNHFAWGSLAEALVSLLGGAAVAKGVALIVFPEATLKAPKTVGRTLTASSVGFALWGGALCWIGWSALWSH